MQTNLSKTLDEHEAMLWQQYLKLEAQGLRQPALRVLDQFISVLLQTSIEHQYRFAEQVCVDIVEHNNVPVRHPLFAKILWPFLVDEYHAGSSATPMWIAHFDKLGTFAQKREALNLDWPTKEMLLREAVTHDPSNTKARRQLIDVMARYFRYTLHELPTGVLYGINGASVTECQKLLASLDEFRELVRTEHLLEDYQEAIEKWQFHYRSYADYLTHHQQYKNYADYTQQHWRG